MLVQNLAPGATDRLGISHGKLRDNHPYLIVCDISGYGDSGPYKEKKAYDLLVQSEAGMLSVAGSEGLPAKVGISVADISAGMYAFTNILGALIKRGEDKENKGIHIDISMLESMVEWMSFPLYYASNNQPGPKLAGASHASIYPCGSFETGSGSSVMLGVQNEREWARLYGDVLENPALSTDARFNSNVNRVGNRDKLRRIMVNSITSTRRRRSLHGWTRQELPMPRSTICKRCGTIHS